MNKNPFTGAWALCAILVVGLMFGGVAALLTSSYAFADTPTSTSGTDCVVTGSSATSGTAVATSASADTASSTPSQSQAQPQPQPQSDLAFTGADLAAAAAVGLFLIGAGVFLVVGSRHRRRAAKVLGCAVLALLVAHQVLPTTQASAATNCVAPPAVLPESPIGLLLPLSALLIFAAAYVWLRRRRAVS